MTSWQDVHELERRARDADALASRLDLSLLREVEPAAGADTWLGPTAAAFVLEARAAGRMLDDVVHDVRAVARRLRRDADDLATSLRATEGLRAAEALPAVLPGSMAAS
jgi:hypothetical protein